MVIIFYDSSLSIKFTRHIFHSKSNLGKRHIHIQTISHWQIFYSSNSSLVPRKSGQSIERLTIFLAGNS